MVSALATQQEDAGSNPAQILSVWSLYVLCSWAGEGKWEHIKTAGLLAGGTTKY